MRNQFTLDLNDELIVDNFAGGGGASTGIEMALGRHVDHAFNHAQDALGMHRINHPQTVHHLQDVFDVDPSQIAGGRRVGLGWFSPDCTHFSKAKGGKPLSKKIRGLALVILRWAAIRTRVIYMENVEEIQTWGPLLSNGRPDKRYKGRTWRAFLSALGDGLDPEHPDIPEILEVLKGSVTMEQLVAGFGYDCEYRELRAADYNTRTIRKRLFLIARCDGLPIVWPNPTHSATGRGADGGRLKPWRPVAECIDWDRPCPSIFLNKRQARLVRCKRPLAKATLRRVATGVGRYVIHAEEPFLVSLTHQGGDRIEPAAPFLTEHANGSHQRNFPSDEPLRTQVAGIKGGHFALVAANLVTNTTGHAAAQATEPGPTIATGGHQMLVAATLARTAHGEQDKNGKKRGRGAHTVSDPLPSTLATQDLAIVSAHLTKFNTGSVGAKASNPAPTIVSGSHSPEAHGGAASTLGLVAASLVKMRGDTSSHPPGKPATEPIHTVSAGGTHHALSCAYLAQQNGGFNTTPGHDAREPLSTISSKGAQQQVVSASVAAYYGSEADGQSVQESLRIVSTKPRFGLAMTEAVAPVMNEAQITGARRVAKFLRAHGVSFEGEFATVGGFVIWDIGIRMLTPRELFRAQGFGDGYVIDRAWVVDPKTGDIAEVRLTKEQQIRMCGNSVCPPVVAALVGANSSNLSIWSRTERREYLQALNQTPAF